MLKMKRVMSAAVKSEIAKEVPKQRIKFRDQKLETFVNDYAQ